MSTSTNQKLSSIPIKIINAPTKGVAGHFKWKRRTVQMTILLLLVLIPVSGLFRIDPENGALVVLGWQIWFADFFLISGLWITILSALVALYSVAGTVVCGWACPQNTVSEWANHMTRKLLGKRAEISLEGEATKIAESKNKLINWTLLVLAFLCASMFFALLPLLYFYPPEVVWSFVTFREDPRLAGSLHWIYTVWVLMILLDIAFVRHFWCRFACIYKVWQHSFKTEQTLHVLYDSSRANECEKCNYCVTTCFIALDPRKTEIYDSCINCGDCIDACNSLQGKKGKVGLLKFEIAQREKRKLTKLRDNSMSLAGRLRWTTPFALIGITLLTWGIWTYQPYHLSVGYLTAGQSQSARDYRVEISSKRYRPSELNVSVEGLPQDAFTISSNKINLDTVGRTSVTISMLPKLQKGLHPFVVVVHSKDGWVGRFTMQHFVE